MAKKKTQSQKPEGEIPEPEFPKTEGSPKPVARIPEVPEVSGEMRGKPPLSIVARSGLLGYQRGGRFFPVRDEDGRMVRVGVTDRPLKMECVACASARVTAAAACASCGGELCLA